MKSMIDLRKEMDSMKISSLELTEQCLDRAKELKHLNAFITLDEKGARKQASQMDAMRDKGLSAGPLHGMPIVIKDNTHVAGLPNTAGTPALQNFVPDSDAPVVARIRAAGAVFIGKANLHELGFGITSNNKAFGAVRNAHNSSYMPGGSSGGTAVAIAAGMAVAGPGTDTGGSSRIPAALNGVVGLRPTIGRYPPGGITPISSTRDTAGSMAQNVADAALLDSVLAGESSCDLAVAEISQLRLGIPRNPFYQDLDVNVAEQAEKILHQLALHNVELVEIDMPDTLDINNSLSFTIVLYEVVQTLIEYLEKYRTGINIDELQAGVVSEDVRTLMDEALSGAISESDYLEALNVRRPLLQSRFTQCFAEHKIDALIFPTTILPAIPIEDNMDNTQLNGKTVPTFQTFIRNCDPASNAGLPALSLPAGTVAGGLPVGMEMVGPAGSDRRLLGIGAALEEILRSV